MAPDGSGRGAGSVEQHGVEEFLGLEGKDIGLDEFGLKPEPLEVAGEPGEPVARGVDCRHPGSRGGELRRLAAGCGAKVGDTQSL